ncbi:MAG: hypothetical protein ACOZJX_02750 [Pseudomonadota bacterium]
MKALIYGIIALAAISCAALQPEHATLLEESAVRIAHGEPGLLLDTGTSQSATEEPSEP